MKRRYITIWIIVLGLTLIACQALTELPFASTATVSPTVTPTPTELPPIPVKPGDENPDEPVFITGNIPYTSPFFLSTISEPFVLLEDQTGFIQRDREFQFPEEGQALGPVEIQEDDTLTFSLALPAIPQGTLVDVDNNNQDDTGVQVFAVAYWSNTWGGPFLEERDGTGWSNAYTSAITDPELDDEIVGGTLVVWAPDDEQAFPTGFGDDGLLFTKDDPTEPIPAGYNIIDLNQEPFLVYKEPRPVIDLLEGVVAVNDYSDQSYIDAFDAMFEKASREYPFTQVKGLDWSEIYDEFAPRIEAARDEKDFYRAVRDFTYSIPDGHVGISIDPEVFFQERGGGFGLVLQELSDDRVIVTQVFPDTPTDKAGIEVGAEILTWGDLPISEAISEVEPYMGPYSTDHHKRLGQVIFLTRVQPDDRVKITYQNPNNTEPRETTMKAEVEYDSLFASLTGLNEDILALPVQAEAFEEFNLGYIRLTTFSDDYNLTASLWERHIDNLIDNEISGLIIDLRSNSGGSSSLALDFAGYFFEDEKNLYEGYYYNERSGEFEPSGRPARIKPGPMYFDGPIAVLIGPYCVSACEGFSYALSQDNRAVLVGHYPTAGAFGEVGRGQYDLPGDYSIQFPTGRSETPDGELVIEGSGILPHIAVPINEESALGQIDAVLEAAIEALLDELE